MSGDDLYGPISLDGASPQRLIAASITRICGALDDDGYTHLYECELPPGHAGDHQSTRRWSNEQEEMG